LCLIMLLKNKINISDGSRVLEIGPGANPYPRSDVYLELMFEDSEVAFSQSGYQSPIQSDKTIFYNGTTFPFEDNSFDYIICSHVLEHVDNVKQFINEINRVGKGKGYIEYPTIYYDYLFNIPEHLNLLDYKDGIIYYAKKCDSPLNEFKQLQKAFNISLFKGYGDVVISLYMPLFVQGFEWQGDIEVKESEYDQLIKNEMEIELILPKRELSNHIGIKNSVLKLVSELKYFFQKRSKTIP
jgi:SAM-dependent methyltransferase